MIDEASRDRLVEALRAKGFVANAQPDHIDFCGHITVKDKDVEAVLRFQDASFLKAPKLILPDPTPLGRHVVPHLDELGVLCVFDQILYLFDPYRAAESCLGILKKAASDLEKNCGKIAEAEIAEELPQHFGGYTVWTEFDKHDGVLALSTVGPRRDTKYSPSVKNNKQPRAFSVTIPVDLSFTSEQPRPAHLGGFLDWIEHWHKGGANLVLQQLSKGAQGALDLVCIVCAQNGQVGFQLKPDGIAPKQAEVFANMSWSQLASLSKIRDIPIKRLQGRRCDLAYVLSRNGGEMGPLSSLKVLLIGCGSIGGFAALSLAQLGAGALDGSFTLIDPDRLSAPNTTRHILGMNAIGEAKTDAVKELIDQHLLGLSVVSIPGEVQSLSDELMDFDLVIDATGEHHISEWLNRFALQRTSNASPAVFHSWIEGRGAAVRSFFNGAPEAGCMRCLHADLEDEKGRYWVLKPEATTDAARPCGDDAYMPYGPSAAMAAAALLNAHVSDWASGNPIKHLLTQRLNFEMTNQVKPVSPSRLSSCPACGARD
ncbi:MAG: ThiF family adenylyltransferase [Pseudomonadota bacterium]